jgi:hypothetical protein
MNRLESEGKHFASRSFIRQGRHYHRLFAISCANDGRQFIQDRQFTETELERGREILTVQVNFPRFASDCDFLDRDTSLMVRSASKLRTTSNERS